MSSAPRAVDKSQPASLRSWLIGLPKPELHVHLEGTTSPQLYARIARRNGVDVDGDPSDAFRCSDFASFLKAFLRVVRVLQQPMDFAEVAAEYLDTAATQGVLHAEIMWSPATQRYFFPDLNLVAACRAIHAAMERAKRASGISSLLILDLVRNLGEEEAMRDIDLALQLRDCKIAGVGLGGDEAHFPARDFQCVFERAKQCGLHRTVHAGEAAGADSIIDAIELLNAERIGHGVAARGRKDVQYLIRKRGVTIDACPTSNSITQAVALNDRHPLPDWLEAGISVSLNSDDPAFFSTSVAGEYERAHAMGIDRNGLAAIAKNGFAASFAGGEEKRRWCDAVDAYVAELTAS